MKTSLSGDFGMRRVHCKPNQLCCSMRLRNSINTTALSAAVSQMDWQMYAHLHSEWTVRISYVAMTTITSPSVAHVFGSGKNRFAFSRQFHQTIHLAKFRTYRSPRKTKLHDK